MSAPERTAKKYGEYGDKWQFYYCEELGLVFFYVDSRPILAPLSETLSVHCKRLNRAVTLKLLGKGQEGYKKYEELAPQLAATTYYPVDLYYVPHSIDPRPSNRVTHEQYEHFCAILDEM